MQNQKFLYSISEAANLLGIGRTNLYGLLNRGELVSVQIGTRRLIKSDSILALIDRATAGAE